MKWLSNLLRGTSDRSKPLLERDTEAGLDQAPVTAESSSRVVRVFVSSTFRDMHAEREQLAKFTFPELRQRCRERGVELVEVDLRWGITEEQSRRGEVLQVCLGEIDRATFFVGLLGQRYGYVPAQIDPVLIAARPWLATCQAHSYTALEILHGVLDPPEQRRQAFLYFRDPAYQEPLSAHRDREAEVDATKARLAALKQRISDGARRGLLTLREDYPNPVRIAERIRDDLWQAIDAQYPQGSAPDALEREAAEHAAFAASRARVYIPRVAGGREIDFERLDAHAAGEGPPLVLLGESGVGKSALLANWTQRHRVAHPDVFIVQHYIGGTPHSTDYLGLVRRLCGEIKQHFNLHDEIPATPDRLRQALPTWLASAHAKGGLVLILDGVNQLEDLDNAPNLGWLPAYIPPKVRLILSTLPGRTQDALARRSWPTYGLAPLDAAARGELIDRFLERYAKRLSKRQIRRIATAPQSGNPLFLRVLLEELRLLGSRHDLDTRIDQCLKAIDAGALYARILERLEHDFGGPRPNLVKDALSFLWAARRGLTERELLELLGGDGEPVPRAHWSPLSLALEDALIDREGLLGFSHTYLREAVQERYLGDQNRQTAPHRHLADYFAAQPLDIRKPDEWLWQLKEARQWAELKACVIDPEFFLWIDEGDLMRYWVVLSGHFDMACEFLAALERYETTERDLATLVQRLNAIGAFLLETANYKHAEAVVRKAVVFSERAFGRDHPETATSIDNLAAVLRGKGDLAGAERLLRRALAICERALGAGHPSTASSLNNLALLLQDKGDFAGADPLLRRALAVSEHALGAEHPGTAVSLYSLAALLKTTGDLAGAEPLYRRALTIREQALGVGHLHTANSLNGLAGLLQAKGDLIGADPLLRRALAIREETLGTGHPDTATSLNNLALLLQDKGDFASAEPLLRRALAIREQAQGVGNRETGASLSSLGALLYAKGDLVGAEPLLRRALAINEQVLGVGHPDTAKSLSNLAELLRAEGDLGGAESLSRRALAIHEQALGVGHADTAIGLNNLAMLLQAKGDLTAAEALFRRALTIFEQVLGAGHPVTTTSRNNLGMLLQDKGDLASAEPLLRRSLAISEQTLGAEHTNTATSLNNLAVLLYAKDDLVGAEPLLRRALNIFEQTLGAGHPNTTQTRESLNRLLGLRAARLQLVSEAQLARPLANSADAPAQPPSQQPRHQTSRNAPCPCGSDRKYKHCCGRVT